MNDDNVVALGHRRTNQENHQYALIEHVRSCGVRGVTWKELAASLNLHHGQASGALSHLNRRDMLARLSVKRDRCSVYVHPDFIAGREVVTSRPVRLVDQLYRTLWAMPQEAIDAAGPEWQERRRQMLDLYGERRG